MGLLVAVVARDAGADVLVLEVDPHRRAVISGLGFEVLDPTSSDVAGHVEAWTGGAGVPIAFEVSGSQPGLDSAVEALAVRGQDRRDRHPSAAAPAGPLPAVLA